MPEAERRLALINLAVAFSHYNEHHQHSALGYRSSREVIATVKEKMRLAIKGQPGDAPSTWMERLFQSQREKQVRHRQLIV